MIIKSVFLLFLWFIVFIVVSIDLVGGEVNMVFVIVVVSIFFLINFVCEGLWLLFFLEIRVIFLVFCSLFIFLWIIMWWFLRRVSLGLVVIIFFKVLLIICNGLLISFFDVVGFFFVVILMNFWLVDVCVKSLCDSKSVIFFFEKNKFK